MHPGSSPEYDSSSSCSTASPGGDTPACSLQPPDSLCSASSMDSAKGSETSASDCFVPTVTAISTSPDLKWMVQPTVITSASPSPGSSKAAQSSSSADPHKENLHSKKAQKSQTSREEEERRRIRRERNKIAAAKCRNRRRELTDTLQAETDKLEEEKAALQTEIADLLKEKERLEQVLASHNPICKLSTDADDADDEVDDEVDNDNDVSAMQEDPPASPLFPAMEGDKISENNMTISECTAVQDMDMPCTSAAAILGNSDILLCSSAEEEPLEDLKGDDLDDLVPSLEMTVADEAAASVPDIDLGGPFCLSDWETLYKSVANDLESLSTPVVSSSPTCSTYRSVFSFNCSEIDSLAESCESTKGSLSATEFTKDSLNSPTLLVL